MALNEYEIKKMMCDVGKRIYDRNMVAANDGNISVKLNDNGLRLRTYSKDIKTIDYKAFSR